MLPEIAFTQHHGSELVRAKPFSGELQSVDPLTYPPDSEQREKVKYDGTGPAYRYPTLGTAPIFGDARVETGIGQDTFPNAIMSLIEPDDCPVKVSSLPASDTPGSVFPSSQPTRRSARAEMLKKKFFIFPFSFPEM
jgi:hypothetical protein